MQISSDRAYWLFSDYRDRSTRLHIGGKIGGEEAACDGLVTAVDLEMVMVELSDPGGSETWHRAIPLGDATFSRYMLGEEGFEPWVAREWHSVLLLKYPDGTSLFFAERF